MEKQTLDSGLTVDNIYEIAEKFGTLDHTELISRQKNTIQQIIQVFKEAKEDYSKERKEDHIFMDNEFGIFIKDTAHISFSYKPDRSAYVNKITGLKTFPIGITAKGVEIFPSDISPFGKVAKEYIAATLNISYEFKAGIFFKNYGEKRITRAKTLESELGKIILAQKVMLETFEYEVEKIKTEVSNSLFMRYMQEARSE